jgi:hypothetical protein
MEGYDKFIAFLKALETGLEVEIDGLTYALAYDSVDKPRITHKMKVTSGDGEERYEYMQGLDLPDINNFIIYIMNQMSDEDVTEINANIALNKIKDEKTRT